MGLRFRKSISLGKFFRLNLSKSGVSVGVGPRGLNVNLGPRGVRQTIGLPGTGVYYQETHQWPKSPEVTSSVNSEVASGSGSGWKIGAVVAVLIAVVVHFSGGSPASDSRTVATIAKPVMPQPVPQVIPPKPDRPLNRDEVRELQTLLRKQGFNAGSPDGVLGPKTRTAAQAFARAHKVKDAQGEPNLQVLNVARGR